MPRMNLEIIKFRIPDDCMAPVLEKGDLVLIDRGRRRLVSDGIYAIRSAEGMQVRRLVMLSDWLVRVACDNPMHPIYEVGVNQLIIVGRIIFSCRILA